MIEKAINVSFDAGEICEIAAAEFLKRIRSLSPLSGGKLYAHFSLDFNVGIKLQRSGEDPQNANDTLVWGTVTAGDLVEDVEVECAKIEDTFESKEPNVERVARNLPLTVETTDGKGGKITKKVRVKG